MKHDPLAAEQLYGFTLFGPKSEGARRLLRQTFAELGIPSAFCHMKMMGFE